MVKIFKHGLALGLVLAFAAPLFAQSDYPVFQLAPGYGNIGFKIPSIGLLAARHSGFTLGTDLNLNSKAGIEVFTGYYNVVTGATLYTNTFGGNLAYRKSTHIVPFGTAGFGFGSLSIGARAMATRFGGGVDIPFNDSIAIRFDATRMGFHFDHAWNPTMNYSVGIVLNLSQ